MMSQALPNCIFRLLTAFKSEHINFYLPDQYFMKICTTNKSYILHERKYFNFKREKKTKMEPHVFVCCSFYLYYFNKYGDRII